MDPCERYETPSEEPANERNNYAPFPPKQEPLSSKQREYLEAFLEIYSEHKRCSLRMLQERFGVVVSTAWWAVKALVRKGYIRMVKQGHINHFIPVTEPGSLEELVGTIREAYRSRDPIPQWLMDVSYCWMLESDYRKRESLRDEDHSPQNPDRSAKHYT